MKRVILSVIACGFSASLLSLHAADEQAPTNNIVSFIDADLSSVALAIVDGKPLTAATVKESVLVLSRVRSLTIGKDIPAPSGRRANIQAMKLAPQLVSSMILDGVLDKKGISSSKNSDSALLSSYNKRFRTSAKSLDELAELFGDLRDAFKRQFVRESRQHAFFDEQPELAVTDADVESFYISVSNKLRRSARIDARATNRMEKAWKELQAGSPWEVVATNYTEDAMLDPSLADNWKDWISLDVSKLEPMDLMVAVSKMKPGEYTRPIETDEGLIIAKLISREDDFCTLARILVRMGVPVAVPTREAAIKKLEREKNTAFQRKYLKSLKESAKIEYPYGKKFVFQIWEEDGGESANKRSKK